MKWVKILFYLAFSVTCIFFRVNSVSCAQQALHYKKTNQTFLNEAPSGPQKILEVWIKKDRIRYESDDELNKFFLVMMNKNKIYELNKIKKTFKEITSERDKLKEMYEHSMVISKRSGKKKKIEKWNCYQINLDMKIEEKKMKASCWLSEDIKIPQEKKKKLAKFSQMKMMEELLKFPGYPVKITINSLLKGKRLKIVNTLVELNKTAQGAEFFKIPFDYIKVTQ